MSVRWRDEEVDSEEGNVMRGKRREDKNTAQGGILDWGEKRKMKQREKMEGIKTYG